MASYLMGEELLGGKFLPGLFSAKLAKKTLAKFDPTSKTAKYGKVVSKGIGFVTGGLIGAKASSAIFTAIGSARGAQKQAKKAVQTQEAAVQQQAIYQAQEPTPAAPEISPIPGPQPASESKPSILVPALVGIGLVAAATMM